MPWPLAAECNMITNKKYPKIYLKILCIYFESPSLFFLYHSLCVGVAEDFYPRSRDLLLYLRVSFSFLDFVRTSTQETVDEVLFPPLRLWSTLCTQLSPAYGKSVDMVSVECFNKTIGNDNFSHDQTWNIESVILEYA
jgi:hypothetical protein